MSREQYVPAETFADGVEWCIACGLNLDQSDIMGIRVALQAARAFRAGLEVPERAMLPFSSLPQPWRVEFERIAAACGAGVPTIAELMRHLPIQPPVNPDESPARPTQQKRGPKSGSDWRPHISRQQ